MTLAILVSLKQSKQIQSFQNGVYFNESCVASVMAAMIAVSLLELMKNYVVFPFSKGLF